jgi:hypothetical protein
LHYGLNARIDLDFSPEAVVEHCALQAAGEPRDPLAMLRGALGNPTGFPPLAKAVVPGDHVAIALEPGVPEADSIVAAVVQCVERAGASLSDVTVLRTRDDAASHAPDPRSLLEPSTRDVVKLETHDPAERGQLGYLANTHAGRPIYLRRAVCDADLVVLVGCTRSRSALNYHGIHGGLYPTFSDTATQRRYRHPRLIDRDASLLALAWQEARYAVWLAGVHFAIQVVPGPDDTALEFFAGEPDAVDRLARERFEAAWEHTVPERAELVIGAITGGPAQQTWENVGRALAAARRVVADGGAIALCTELAASPGPAMRGLIDVDDLPRALRRVQRQRLDDMQPASELIKAVMQSRVYLLSQLDETTVEELGIAAIGDAADLARLARRQRRCVLLSDAQYNMPTAHEDLATL